MCILQIQQSKDSDLQWVINITVINHNVKLRFFWQSFCLLQNAKKIRTYNYPIQIMKDCAFLSLYFDLELQRSAHTKSHQFHDVRVGESLYSIYMRGIEHVLLLIIQHSR